MSALQISTMIFALVIAASIAGVLLAPSLSAKYLSANDSREFFKAVRNVIIGLVSFSLGLLVTSSKTDFQKHRDELKGQATNIIVLDRVLRDYGPEANPARAELRRTSSMKSIRYNSRRMILLPTQRRSAPRTWENFAYRSFS